MIDMTQLTKVNDRWNMGPLGMPRDPQAAEGSTASNWYGGEGFFPGSQEPGGPPVGGGETETIGAGEAETNYGGENLPTPWQWDMSADILQNLYGAGVQVPGVWNMGAKSMMDMMRTGRPADVSGIYGAQQPIAERQMEELGASMLEKFDVGGLGASTAYLGATQREMERMVENMTLARTQAEIGAHESAMGRVIGAAGPAYQFGAGMAGIQGSNLDRQMQLANMAHGQGYTETMYPMQVAQGLNQMGGNIFGQQGQQINQMMNDPYLAAMLGMYQQGAGGYYQPQYQPGFGSTMMNVGAGIGQFVDWDSIFGGGGMPQTQLPPGNTYGDLPFPPMQNRYFPG